MPAFTAAWGLASASRIQGPGRTFADLKNRGSRRKPPAGWKFRSPILEKDLVVMTDKGTTVITPDEIGGTCDRIGAPGSNVKP